MTDDQNPWYPDANGELPPPPAPGGGTFPTNLLPPPAAGPPPWYGPQQYPQQPPTGYQTYGHPAYGPAAYGPVAQSNGRATTSMVLGIVGLASMFFCYGITSIIMGPIAFFLGRSAQKEMATTPSAWSNAGMAKAGWIMGLIQTILSVIAIAAIAAFFIWAATLDDSNF